jgi:hypothetical protein
LFFFCFLIFDLAVILTGKFSGVTRYDVLVFLVIPGLLLRYWLAAAAAQRIAAESPQEAHGRFRGLGAESLVRAARSAARMRPS